MARTAHRFLGTLAAITLIGIGLTTPAAQAGTSARTESRVVFPGEGLKVKLDHHPAALRKTSPGFRRYLDRELRELWGWDDHRAECRNAPVVFVQEYRSSGFAYLSEGVYAVKGHADCAGGGNWQFAVRRDGRWVSPRALGGQDVPSCQRLRRWNIPRMTGAEQCYDGSGLVGYHPA